MGGTDTGHFFQNEQLISIDYLNQQPNYFIASGNSFDHSILKFYRYKYKLWKDCTTKFPFESIKNTETNKSEHPYLSIITYEVSAYYITGVQRQIDLYTECGLRDDEDEEIDQIENN